MIPPDPGDFDFELPASAVAQWPAEERAASRLMVLDRRSGAVADRIFRDLPACLPPGALLVVNDTRVIPARLIGTRPTGGKVEVLLVGPGERPDRWRAWIRPSARVRPGMTLTLGAGLIATPVSRDQETWTVDLSGPAPVAELLERAGAMPLPPYIDRQATDADKERYQTVFAEERGAVAAPTAGLHFTPALLGALEEAGHAVERITLHVGPGTFAPLRPEQLAAGRLHGERYRIRPQTWERIEAARAEGRPIVAVGTTVVRTLESAARGGEGPGGGPQLSGETTLFITPGFSFQVVDHLITNFHLPRSSLLMLVAAFAGRERILDAYRRAVLEGYRFYSYGDATLIL